MPDFKIENYYDFDEDQEENEEILEPFYHIAHTSGKKVRSIISKALNEWLHISQEKLEEINFILDICHNASLVIDDIQDSSILRRGILCSHKIFGVSRTLSAALFAAQKSFDAVLTENWDVRAREIMIRKWLDLFAGQGMEIYWRDNFICPTLEEYKLMCIRKTGGLFLLGVELMQLYYEGDEDFTKFATTLGLYFQIRDDYMNLASKEYEKKKTFCEDISEGKFSFPIIHAILTRPDDKRVINILKQRPSEDAVKKQCLNLLKEFGSLKYTRNYLVDMRIELFEELKKLPENQLMDQLLNNILDFE